VSTKNKWTLQEKTHPIKSRGKLRTLTYILLSATVPDDPGYFGERLGVARNKLVGVWKQRSARLQPSFASTDILGALFLASQIFSQQPSGAERRILVLFSDMRNHTRDLDLELTSQMDAMRAHVKSSPVPVDLAGVRVCVLGMDGAGKPLNYWKRLEEFWMEYFRDSGSALSSFSHLRELTISTSGN
jgi:hypothetical protein